MSSVKSSPAGHCPAGPMIIAMAKQRGGHGEKIHAPLKRELAGGILPAGRFGANADR